MSTSILVQTAAIIAFFTLLVIVEQILRRNFRHLVLSQSRRHQASFGWRNFLRMIQKDDRSAPQVSVFLFRFFVLAQLLCLIVLVCSLGRDLNGLLMGDFLVIVVTLFTLTTLCYFHVWALKNKTLIMADFAQLETRLLVDFGFLAISGLVIFYYDTSSLLTIENKQAVWSAMGGVKMPIAAALMFFLIPIKFSQHPFNGSKIFMGQRVSIENDYSGISRALMQLLEPFFFTITSLLYIHLFWGGAASYGLLDFQWATSLQPIKPYFSLAIKFILLLLIHHTVFMSFPLFTNGRVQHILRRWLIVLLVIQIAMIATMQMRS